MQKEPIIDKAIRYIGKLLQGNSDGHGLDHTMRVYHTAMQIAGKEPGCNKLIVALGALLHDADDEKLFKTQNNANARAFLDSQQTDPADTDRICAVINAVSFHKNREKKPETLEGRIVQDADRLDAIGAVGIARAFAYGGSHSRPLVASIDHFHEKLLLLKDMMNTSEARKIAAERHRFMEDFLQEWTVETAEQTASESAVYSRR